MGGPRTGYHGSVLPDRRQWARPRPRSPIPHHAGGQSGGPDEVIGGAGRRLPQGDHLRGPAAQPHRQRIGEVAPTGAVRPPAAARSPQGPRHEGGWSLWPPGRRGPRIPRRACDRFVDGHGSLFFGQQPLDPSRRPSIRLSRAASKSAAERTSRSSCTALIAASFTRLARSAPENPGAPRDTGSRSTSGPNFLSRPWTARIALRSIWLGSGISTVRSKRPGRSRAGSRISRRLVAPITTTLVSGSNPSISDSSWLRVCSRSSFQLNPPGPRRPPMASISSMKMIAGARLRASAKRSPHPWIADADEHLDEARSAQSQERYVGLARHRSGQQRLPGPGRTHHEDALGTAAPASRTCGCLR